MFSELVIILKKISFNVDLRRTGIPHKIENSQGIVLSFHTALEHGEQYTNAALWSLNK